MTDSKDKSAYSTLEKPGILVVPFHMARDFEAARDSGADHPAQEVRFVIIDAPYVEDPAEGPQP